MIEYRYKVVKLAKRKKANGLIDVITSITIHYIASENGKEALARCTLDYPIPESSNGFVPYDEVTPEMMIEWSKERIDYEIFNPDLERQLRQTNQTDEVIFE